MIRIQTASRLRTRWLRTLSLSLSLLSTGVVLACAARGNSSIQPAPSQVNEDRLRLHSPGIQSDETHQSYSPLKRESSLASGTRKQGAESAGPAAHLTNALRGESSPYLLEHADDPVAWQPWGDAAFARASREDKPVFLMSGFSACHWCHVMQREDFRDPAIARYLNDHFVCIAVDREQRPDVDDVYLNAVEAITGTGGWPLSVFLTPDRKPFAGATYLPPAEFQSLLDRVVAAFRDRRPSVNQFADRVSAAVASQLASGSGAELPAGIMQSAVASQLARYDSANGGFGSRPKFLEAPTLSFLLERYRRTGDRKLLQVVTSTLSHMADGGVHDQLGGGFHRYSTDANWRVPHFEKMLYDQALMALVYLQAFQVSGDLRFRDVALDTLNFAIREMKDPAGGFYSSVDADSGGVEGQYYLWTPAQATAALGPAAPLFEQSFGVSTAGDVRGGSVLHAAVRPAQVARQAGMTMAAFEHRIAALRTEALAARERRAHPALDRKVLASWNGLMISALSRAFTVTHERRFLDLALDDANFVLKQMVAKGILMHSWHDGTAAVPGLLEDYAAMANGLLDLSGAAGDVTWQRHAEQLADQMVVRFQDPSGPGFFSSADPAGLIVRRKDSEDTAAPSANGLSARLFAHLAQITREARWRQLTLATAGAFAPIMSRSPGAFLSILTAVSSVESLPAHGAPSVVQLEISGPPVATANGIISFRLRVQVSPGWHINAHRASAAYLIPTVLRLSPGSGFSLEAVDYPPGLPARLALSPEVLSTYQGSVVLTARLRSSEAGRPGRRPLTFILSYQACSDKSCLRPAEVKVESAVKSQP